MLKRKLYDYALNPAHTHGGPKARLWRAVFDIGREDWRYVRGQLLAGVLVAVVSDIRQSPDATTYQLIMTIRGLNGHSGPVTTAWQFIGDAPRLVTAFPRV